jgi:hypothetical protein
MRVIDSWIGCIMIALASHLPCASLLTAQTLEGWLETPKIEYKFCESIYAYMFVVNKGSEPVRVPFVKSWDHSRSERLLFDVLKDDVDTMRYTGIIGPHSEDTLTLASGDTAMFVLDVIGSWGQGGRGAKYPPCLPPGKYTAKAIYMGNAHVAPCDFKIVALTAAEEEQIALFAKVKKSGLQGRARLDAYIAAYRELKDTPFGTRVGYLVLLLCDSKTVPYAERVQYASEFAQRYPDDGGTQRALSLMIWYQDGSKRVDSFRELSGIRSNKYTRFLFKSACLEHGWMNIYKEVMK